MKLILSAAALWILLTPALAQQADQPVADPAQPAAAAEVQPAAESTGMTQAAAQLAAQAAQAEEEQGSSEAQNTVAPPAAEQLPAAMPAPVAQPPEQQHAPQPNAAPQSQDQTLPPSDDAAPPYDAGAAQPPIAQPSRQRRALAVAPALRPRAEAAAYPVYRQLQQFSVGATLLSAKEVEQKFSTPLGKHYLVVEVGVFPADAQAIQLRPENFTLRVPNDDQAFFPATPEDIAGALSGSRPRRPGVYPNLGVGYGGGGWGRGVYTGVGVGVNPYPRRGGMDGGNHRVMENELRDKSLPEGSLTQPVAGYLYFPLNGKRSDHYNLELTRNGETMSLALPAPKK